MMVYSTKRDSSPPITDLSVEGGGSNYKGHMI